MGVSAEFRVHTSRIPPESPVRMSPVLRKTRHWTNFGFSYFCDTTRNEVTTRSTEAGSKDQGECRVLNQLFNIMCFICKRAERFKVRVL